MNVEDQVEMIGEILPIKNDRLPVFPIISENKFNEPSLTLVKKLLKFPDTLPDHRNIIITVGLFEKVIVVL